LKTSILPAVALVVFATIPVAAQDTGDLKLRIEFDGAAPTQAELRPTKDTEYCGKHKLLEESLIVNPENKGVQNAIVHVYTSPRGGSKLSGIAPSNKKVTLANEKCRFEPHVVLVQTGDTLVVTNPDPIGHNANLSFIMNVQMNPLIPAGGEVSIKLEELEPAPIPVECNIHPWMRAFVVVQDHPFMAVTDKNGELTIKGLPAGDKLIFRAVHESGDFRGAEIQGAEPVSRRGTFEVEIKPGVNDIGTILMKRKDN